MHDPREAGDELERGERTRVQGRASQRPHMGCLSRRRTMPAVLGAPRGARRADLPPPSEPDDDPGGVRGLSRGLAQAIFGWAAKTGGHALRLVLSGLFDRFPSLTIILGHMGEAFPFYLWRIDSRFKISEPAPPDALRVYPPEHRRHHRRRLRTRAAALRDRRNGPRPCAVLGRLSARGQRRGRPVHETAPLSEVEREAVCFRNAERVLRL